MSENTWVVLIVVAVCSYLAVKAWVNARRAEREAFYRSETLKKFAEMQGTIPESVLQVLREAVKQNIEPPTSLNYDYNREREAYYRSETVKKIAELSGGAAALEYLREDEKKSALRRTRAVRLGGMITTASGIALMTFLYAVVRGQEVYLAGLIPILVGLSLIVYAVTSAPVD